MRKPFVAGNWKMHRTVAEARQLVTELVPALQGIKSVERVLCPPFIDLLAVAALVEGTDIGLGAQNMHWETSGAYTGEISPLMVAELCHYVIIGHSERRAYFGENDETVNRKVKAALANGLIPIVCVGETLDEYEADRTSQVVSRQIGQGLAGIDGSQGAGLAAALVVAYEPVWAIGTGRPSTPDGAARVIREVIRSALQDHFGSEAAQNIRVLYGGSVNGKNAAEFFSEEEIDGALVGGASLKAADFTQIVQAAAR
jgi:triosephosphate isomerase